MRLLKIRDTLKGRAIKIERGGKVYISRKYKLYSYEVDTKKLSLLAQVPCSPLRQLIEPSRLLCRLLRHEIRGFVTFPDGSKAVATRQALHYGSAGETLLKPASVPHPPTVMAPLSLTEDSQGRILCGEYWSNNSRRGVRVLASADKGKSYESVFEFKPGEIRHIHSVSEDEYDGCFWVFAGDHNKEPGIGRLSKDFKNFEWLVKGEQKYRATGAFIFKDKIIYGTDTEKDFNGIYSVNKSTGKTEKLCDIPGSAIFSGRFGKWYVISTGVEYFEKYKTTNATLWMSKDSLNWEEVYKAPKDLWSIKYFQFGALVLPTGQWDRDELVFSGRAVRKFDNSVCIAEIVEEG